MEINRILWEVNFRASKKMMQMGYTCMAICLLDMMVAITTSKGSSFLLFATVFCFAIGIFDFCKAYQFSKIAKRYEKEIEEQVRIFLEQHPDAAEAISNDT